jgi:uncharacterized membrane protein
MILRSFFRGLLVTVPVAATLYILYVVFIALDSIVDSERWFGRVIPGIGVAVVLVAITVIGFITQNVLTRWVITLMDRFFEHMPGAKIIYSAIKDVMEALVGEKKKFDRPVAVQIVEGGPEAIGFITRENVEWIHDGPRVAVYFPQSYNFAGQVLLFPRERVRALEAESADIMKFIVSGGVS